MKKIIICLVLVISMSGVCFADWTDNLKGNSLDLIIMSDARNEYGNQSKNLDRYIQFDHKYLKNEIHVMGTVLDKNFDVIIPGALLGYLKLHPIDKKFVRGL